MTFANFLIINIIFPINGLLLIIFRKEACVILQEHRAKLKEKHPKIWRHFHGGLIVTEWAVMLIGIFFLVFPLLNSLAQ